MAWRMAGIIEGFYGRPWTWEERLQVLQHLARRGMTDYVYAPKDDPLHRTRWRDPYSAEELAGFTRLVEESGVRVGFAISPGLSIDYETAEDRTALLRKLESVIDAGVHSVCLALDDIPPREGLGDDHARLTTWVRHELAAQIPLLLVPTDYTSTGPTPYLDELAEGLPEGVAVAWTGPTVVCDEIPASAARARAAALGDRSPVVWDNYPCNDTLMSDQLFMGPLRGRDPELVHVCSGYLANPLTQPRASTLPLTSTAAYLSGEDPTDAWADEADARGWRVFAEAVDGARPRSLVARLVEARPATDDWIDALGALRSWLELATTCTAAGLEAEVQPWLDQVRAEAEVCMTAVRLLEQSGGTGDRAGQPPDPAGASEHAMVLAFTWRQARHAPITAFGPRLGFRPVLSHRRDATWRFHRESVLEDANATDSLVRYALGQLATA